MAFSELVSSATQRFNDAAKDQAGFNDERSKIVATFTENGAQVNNTCIEAMALLHCNQLKKRADLALKSLLDVMDAASVPVSPQNITEMRSFLHTVLNREYTSLRAGDDIERLLSLAPQYRGLWKKQLAGTLVHEKTRLDAKLELMLNR